MVLGYVYTIPDSLCADTKTISDRASVHKGNPDFDAVLTTERRCAASILKVNRHVWDRFSYTLWHRVNRFSTAAEVNNSEGGLNSTIFVLISAISNAAVFSLQLCIMNLTALNHRKRRGKRLELLLMLKDLRKRTNGRSFPCARLIPSSLPSL